MRRSEEELARRRRESGLSFWVELSRMNFKVVTLLKI
jgi:hypothetical protein